MPEGILLSIVIFINNISHCTQNHNNIIKGTECVKFNALPFSHTTSDIYIHIPNSGMLYDGVHDYLTFNISLNIFGIYDQIVVIM